MMAGSIDEFANGVIKLQALVRGHLVRREFMKTRSEYKDLMVQLEENNDISVTWKSCDKPCLPTVSHTNNTSSNGEKKLLNHQECSPTPPISPMSPNGVSKQVSQEFDDPKELVVHSRESDMMDNHKIPDVEELSSMENLNSSTSDTNTKLDENVKNTEDNVLGYLQDKKTGFQPLLGLPLDSYPKEKAALVKLREDLAMELLWIQQAIESRKNYLVMKQNLS